MPRTDKVAFDEIGTITIELRAVKIVINNIGDLDPKVVQQSFMHPGRMIKEVTFGEQVNSKSLDITIKTSGNVKGRDVADVAMRTLRSIGCIDDGVWKKAREGLYLPREDVQWFYPASDIKGGASEGMIMVSGRNVFVDLYTSREKDLDYILEGCGLYSQQSWVKAMCGISDIRVGSETKSEGGMLRMEFEISASRSRDGAREWAKFVMREVLLKEGRWLREEEFERASKAFGRERG